MTDKVLLLSDLHLDDNPLNEYRWEVFKQARDICKQYNINAIFILGDALDRKDRHSGNLVNRLVNSFQWLQDNINGFIYVLAGNHDAPIYGGVYYWTFLNYLKQTRYITEPWKVYNYNIWALPFSSNPKQDWEKLDLKNASAILMHQTLAGAVVERDYKIEKDSNPMPILPNIPIYSGDVHRPQTLGNVVYVGVPYQTRFGEDWNGRALVVDTNDWSKYTEILLDNVKKLTFDVYSVDELNMKLQVGRGGDKKEDQIRIRYYLKQEDITRWATIENSIRDLVKSYGLNLLSLESIFQQALPQGSETSIANQSGIEQVAPEQVIKLFADEEKLSEDLTKIGLEIVKETM